MCAHVVPSCRRGWAGRAAAPVLPSPGALLCATLKAALLSCPPSRLSTCHHRRHPLGDVHRRVCLLDAAKGVDEARVKGAAAGHRQQQVDGGGAVAVKLPGCGKVLLVVGQGGDAGGGAQVAGVERLVDLQAGRLGEPRGRRWRRQGSGERAEAWPRHGCQAHAAPACGPYLPQALEAVPYLRRRWDGCRTRRRRLHRHEQRRRSRSQHSPPAAADQEPG